MFWEAHIDRRYEFCSAGLLALYLSHGDFAHTRRVKQLGSVVTTHCLILISGSGPFCLEFACSFCLCVSITVNVRKLLSDIVSSVMESNLLRLFLYFVLRACLDTLLLPMTPSRGEDSE